MSEQPSILSQVMKVSADDLQSMVALSTEFGFLVDEGRAADCEALFLPNAKLIFGPGSPKPGTLDGVAAIREFLVSRQAQTHITTRHIATNFRAVWQDAQTLAFHSLLTFYRSADQTREPVVASISDVEELFRRDGQGIWKIAQRTVTPIFVRSS